LLAALEASGTQIVTVAIRRLDLDNPNEKTLLDYIDWGRFQVLPNTAGSRTADEAVFAARLGRSVTGSDWVKLEVIPDAKYLLPDPIGTLEAAERLVAEGFKVLPYINADPVLARRLEEIGTVTVMPLASPIGSGQGVTTLDAIRVIVEQARIPVVVDAGLGVPSEAAIAMEAGADAVLVNALLAAFNLIPIPPLDMTRVVTRYLPPRPQEVLANMEQYGALFMLVIFFIIFGPIHSFVDVIANGICQATTGGPCL